MGDTLRVPNRRPSKSAAQIPAPVDPPQGPSQPRKFELLDAQAKNAQNKKDNSMRLEIGNYLNLPVLAPGPGTAPPGHRARQDSALFLFNPGRQDLISSLLNNYPAAGSIPQAQSSGPRKLQPLDSNFPSYYMSHRDSNPNQPGAGPEAPTRLRGDSIFLPPPATSKYNEEAPHTSANSSIPMALRSNSIFSSLIQIPGSLHNSISEKEKPSSSRTRRSTASSTEYLQEYDSLVKDSFSNIFGWNQEKPGKKGSKGSIDAQNAFWATMNGGGSGSIAGISNAFLNSIQSNGSIDFGNMSNEQRRDSILKFINDQQVTYNERKSSEGKTQLREDIFEQQQGSKPLDSKKRRKTSLSLPQHSRLSPTSSRSSKSSNRHDDEPHSPKTSPSQLHRTMDPNNAQSLQQAPQHYPPGIAPQNQTGYYLSIPQNEYQYNYSDIGQYQQPPVQNLRVKEHYHQFQQSPPINQRIPENYITNNAGGYSQPLFRTPNNQFNTNDRNNYSYHPASPDNQTQQNFQNPGDEKVLVPAQQFARSEDGRPLLGATKVDQLMLVIQAREKGNVAAIKQAPDGSILASPNSSNDKSSVLPLTVGLVGGVSKPIKEEEEDSDLGSDAKKKRKGKNQQCPYCFKQFSQSTHLEVHVRSHIGYKPFQCTFCLKRFTQGGNLRTHMRLHTGEKPFTCEICHRSFSRKGNLAAHMLTHNKEKPFECKLDGCDKSFTQLGNLKSHQNKFHLPTLNKMTQTLAELSGEALESLPAEERELLDYFRKLYKNSNKGIRGRGRGKKVPTLGDSGDDAISATSSAHTSPQAVHIQMQKPMQMSQQHSPPLLQLALDQRGIPNTYDGNSASY